MAKTATLKSTNTSIRSRAAKRATSPSINLDRSLKTVKPPPATSNARLSVLAAHQSTGAGISKKKSDRRVMSTRARKRQEKGLERAEVVMERTEMKVLKSKGKARMVDERRADWKDLNDKIGKEGVAPSQQRGKSKPKGKARQPTEDLDGVASMDLHEGGEELGVLPDAAVEEAPPIVDDDDQTDIL